MNKEQENMITDWLEKHGNPEIEKQVEKQVEKEMININAIEEYCKYMNIKFIKYHKNGFIASYNFPIKAGMEYAMHNCKIISLPIKVIGYKKIYRKYICNRDGDIVDDGIFSFFKISKVSTTASNSLGTWNKIRWHPVHVHSRIFTLVKS